MEAATPLAARRPVRSVEKPSYVYDGGNVDGAMDDNDDGGAYGEEDEASDEDEAAAGMLTPSRTPKAANRKVAGKKVSAKAAATTKKTPTVAAVVAAAAAAAAAPLDPAAVLAQRDAEIKRLKLENQRLRSKVKELVTAAGAPDAADKLIAALAVPAPLPAAAAASTALARAGAAAPVAVTMTPQQLEAAATRLRRMIKSSISAQMIYKPSMKYSSKRLSVEVPNLSAQEVRAILGPELVGRATITAKQIVVEATNEELETINLNVTKSLRFGSHLQIFSPLKFTYQAGTRSLKLLGSVGMSGMRTFSNSVTLSSFGLF